MDEILNYLFPPQEHQWLLETPGALLLVLYLQK